MKDTQLLLDSNIQIVSQLSSNHRWRSYEAQLNGQKIFVKVCADSGLYEAVNREVAGLESIKSKLPAKNKLFNYPELILRKESHIVTSFMDGSPIKSEDFFSGPFEGSYRQKALSIYEWFDKSYPAKKLESDDPKFKNILDWQQKFKDNLAKLRNLILEFTNEDYINSLEYSLSEFTRLSTVIKLKETHPDLKYGNILFKDGSLSVIDFESFGYWPEYYQVVDCCIHYARRFPDCISNVGHYLDLFFKTKSNYQDAVNLNFHVGYLSRAFSAFGPRTSTSASKGNLRSEPEWLDINMQMFKAVKNGRMFWQLEER